MREYTLNLLVDAFRKVDEPVVGKVIVDFSQKNIGKITVENDERKEDGSIVTTKKRIK